MKLELIKPYSVITWFGFGLGVLAFIYWYNRGHWATFSLLMLTATFLLLIDIGRYYRKK